MIYFYQKSKGAHARQSTCHVYTYYILIWARRHMLTLEQIYFSLKCNGYRTTHTWATWVLWTPIKIGKLSGKEWHWSEERFNSSQRLASVFSLHASDRIQSWTIKEHCLVCMCVRKSVWSLKIKGTLMHVHTKRKTLINPERPGESQRKTMWMQKS